MDLKGLITKNQCECLGGTDDYPLEHVFTDGGNSLKSDFDDQLILSVNFNQSIKIHAIKLKAPEKFGPKTLKLFINQIATMSFEQAESCPAVQDMIVDPKDLAGNLINLRPVKFAVVNSIQIFIINNQSGSGSTQLDYIGFIGSPLPAGNNSISTDVDIEGIKQHKQKIINLLKSDRPPKINDMEEYFWTGYSPKTLGELYDKRHELLSIIHDSNLFAQKIAEIVQQHHLDAATENKKAT
ncbi:thioredoxin-like protein 1 [Contarinia nasturtii]|uniref:thioredoxin-like protein 1 n=1 Tax=Contarinia nasturtii TaxID=265458 RepID=UPI0012D3D450|nr:thioredoxin-like protein 1 [Contarinia nasturtii]XP_031630839.1 thioredoxin-like protein 1 [Contarinia nasturtii]XP_031630840.1 thioredoxin-like protein 1 [Contarinia nasturtii]XP_031630841.1 thioredoxin-like protein 1 [Contarinia nasturtii]